MSEIKLKMKLKKFNIKSKSKGNYYICSYYHTAKKRVHTLKLLLIREIIEISIFFMF